MEKAVVDQKDDIINRYPDMVLVPVDLYFKMEKRSRIQVLFFFIVTTILSLFLGVHFGYRSGRCCPSSTMKSHGSVAAPT